MKKVFSSLGIGLGCVLATSTSLAQIATQSRDCEAIRARAAGDAALLLSPSVSASVIKYPSSTSFTEAIGGSTTTAGWQGRVAFMWSPLNAYQSVLVRQMGDKECANQIAIIEASEALEQLQDVGKQTALTNELEYLASQRSVVEDVLAQANKRLVAGTATVMDMTMLQQQSSALELRRIQAQGQLDILLHKKYIAKNHSFSELMTNVQNTSMQFERKASSIRMLSPWKFDVSGGVVPPMMSGETTSIFFVGTITYNFGGIPMAHNENQYLDARSRELTSARHELTHQLSLFRDVVKANIEDMNRQLATLDSHNNLLTYTYNNLSQHSDAAGALNAMALIKLQMIDAESNRAMVAGMLNELNTFYGEGK